MAVVDVLHFAGVAAGMRLGGELGRRTTVGDISAFRGVAVPAAPDLEDLANAELSARERGVPGPLIFSSLICLTACSRSLFT